MSLDIEKLTDGVVDVIDDALRPFAERIKQLETRLAEVEAKSLRYCGAWQKALDYNRGSTVTHGGSLWIATRDTNERPGSGDGWQLATKGAR